MKIISHRGFWKKQNEKNTNVAFFRAIKNGFGVETDVRDYCGELVISHNMPTPKSQTLDNFLEFYVQGLSQKYEPPMLAINIKSDGLQTKLEELLYKYKITNYFVFDMSVPDSINYLDSNMNVFMRKSECEEPSKLLNNINGVWLDQLLSDWYSPECIIASLNSWNNVCVVSPELHGREHRNCWRILKKIKLKNSCIMLCTDYPQQAEEYFNGK